MPVKPPAISGVSAGREALIHFQYPSIACTGVGLGLGKLYDSIPLRIGGVKLSHLLFVLPTAPIALLIYAWLKIAGGRYVITNRGVQIRGSLSSRLMAEVPLGNIASILVREEPGQAFYPAADLYLLNEKGESLLVLRGVPWPEVFKQNILEARNARIQVEASLATIAARAK